MLDGFLKGLTIIFWVVIVPSILAVLLVPPGLVCFYMGWSFYIYEYVAGAWFIILASWFMVVAFFKGWIA